MKMKVKIYKTIKQTAGGFHSWCKSNVGVIRKPNSSIECEVPIIFKEELIKQKEKEFVIAQELGVPLQQKWYLKAWIWIKSLFIK